MGKQDKSKSIGIIADDGGGRCRKKLLQMNEFRLEGLLCDVELSCDDGRRFPAHKLVLASASPYFRAMFQNEMLEKSQSVITMKSIDSRSLEMLIDYAYSSEFRLDVKSVRTLLGVANMLCFDEVERDCISYLCSNLNLENCVDVFTAAEKINCSELQNLAELFVTNNFKSLVKNLAFLRLAPHQLEAILDSDNLNVTSEAEVFEAVLRWIKYDIENRKQYLSTLLNHVRLILLSRKYLVDKVMSEALVMEDGDCRGIVLRALDHHLLPERRLESTLTEVAPRKLWNRFLFAVGGEAKGVTLKSAECFNIATDTWTEIAPMIMPRKNVAVVTLDGILYALGGINNEYQDLVTVEKYDIDNAIWSSVASLKHCKGALSVAAVDGWLYAVGGSNNSSALKDVERYDPLTDTWTEITPMRLPRSHFGMASIRGRIYAVGGYCGISEVEHCESFDPHTCRWTEITGMNKSRMNHSVVSCGDRLYAIGGVNSLGSLNSIEKYNPDLNMWLVIKNCIGLRSGVSVAINYQSADGNYEVVIVGGQDSSAVEQNEVRRLQLKSPDYSIRAAPSMIEKRCFAGVCVL